MSEIEIINKIMNAKPDENIDFGKYIITIENNIENYGIDKGMRYFTIQFKKNGDWRDNWILKSDGNKLTTWKTLNGAKRYILKKMEFYTGLKFAKNKDSEGCGKEQTFYSEIEHKWIKCGEKLNSGKLILCEECVLNTKSEGCGKEQVFYSQIEHKWINCGEELNSGKLILCEECVLKQDGERK